MSKKVERKRKTPQKRPHGERISRVRNQQVGCWDELNQIRLYCLNLMATPRPVIEILRDQEAIRRCCDQQALLRDSKTLQTDLETYKNRLEDIHSRHASRRGGSEDPDELLTALTIGEEYNQWILSYQTIISPTVSSLTNNLLGKDPAGDEGVVTQEVQQ